MTQIVVSIPVHDVGELDAALDFADAAAGDGAALVEWRLDALAMQEDARVSLARLLEASPLPCIVTVRPAWEGGEYEGDEADRAEFLAAALTADHPPRYVDVELTALERENPFRTTIEGALALGDRQSALIVSMHDFNERPRDLLQRVARMTTDPLCTVMKVAWRARSLRDNLEAFELLRERRKPMVAICMGRFGLMSRVLAPKFGGMLTYCGLHEEIVTAPGQTTVRELRGRYRFDAINERTRVYGVIGWPIEHSIGPEVHNAACGEAQHDGVYLPLPVPAEWEHFKATVGALLDAKSLDFRGASVTIPHKEHLLRLVREHAGTCDEWAERCGAANTLVVGDDGGLRALNTDAPAILQCVQDAMGDDLRGQRAVVLGAGGAARAAVAALQHAGMSIIIINRAQDRAAQLAQQIQSNAGDIRAGVANDLREGAYDLLINCTPIGMKGGPAPNQSPLDALADEGGAMLNENMVIFDTVYRPQRTKLIEQAETAGATIITGAQMFAQQARLQLMQWTNHDSRITFLHRLINDALHEK